VFSDFVTPILSITQSNRESNKKGNQEYIYIDQRERTKKKRRLLLCTSFFPLSLATLFPKSQIPYVNVQAQNNYDAVLQEDAPVFHLRPTTLVVRLLTTVSNNLSPANDLSEFVETDDLGGEDTSECGLLASGIADRGHGVLAERHEVISLH